MIELLNIGEAEHYIIDPTPKYINHCEVTCSGSCPPEEVIRVVEALAEPYQNYFPFLGPPSVKENKIFFYSQRSSEDIQASFHNTSEQLKIKIQKVSVIMSESLATDLEASHNQGKDNLYYVRWKQS